MTRMSRTALCDSKHSPEWVMIEVSWSALFEATDSKARMLDSHNLTDFWIESTALGHPAKYLILVLEYSIGMKLMIGLPHNYLRFDISSALSILMPNPEKVSRRKAATWCRLEHLVEPQNVIPFRWSNPPHLNSQMKRGRHLPGHLTLLKLQLPRMTHANGSG